MNAYKRIAEMAASYGKLCSSLRYQLAGIIQQALHNANNGRSGMFEKEIGNITEKLKTASENRWYFLDALASERQKAATQQETQQKGLPALELLAVA
jgi:hypothetical protein